jgi:hypothetical protein
MTADQQRLCDIREAGQHAMDRSDYLLLLDYAGKWAAYQADPSLCGAERQRATLTRIALQILVFGLVLGFLGPWIMEFWSIQP